jgi:hypothetical protein
MAKKGKSTTGTKTVAPGAAPPSTKFDVTANNAVLTAGGTPTDFQSQGGGQYYNAAAPGAQAATAPDFTSMYPAGTLSAPITPHVASSSTDKNGHQASIDKTTTSQNPTHGADRTAVYAEGDTTVTDLGGMRGKAYKGTGGTSAGQTGGGAKIDKSSDKKGDKNKGGGGKGGGGKHDNNPNTGSYKGGGKGGGGKHDNNPNTGGNKNPRGKKPPKPPKPPKKGK